jgi:glycosyltransferase involved in cell wall biosynthesis
MSLLVFDSHPVQYRVPVWREMERRKPGSVHVAYASDCSVRGHADAGFGRNVAWDDPMMEGYSCSVLSAEKGEPLSGWGSLTGKGVGGALDRLKPKAVLLTGLNYRFDWAAYAQAKRRGIPVWLRCETQDESVRRSGAKPLLRGVIYRMAYFGLNRTFWIGTLNRQHYQRHGVSEARLRRAAYGTVDRFAGWGAVEKAGIRAATRVAAGIPEDAVLVGFSGKFIPKKHPDILFEMLAHLPEKLRSKVWLYFLGSGELEPVLRTAAELSGRATFAGFANQSQLASHYLAMDLLVLPSRRMGETWGLVANEAMQGGCGIIVSNAVGCGADFAGWERFRIFGEEDAKGLAEQVGALAELPRSFDWAEEGLKAYSLEAAAAALLAELHDNG